MKRSTRQRLFFYGGIFLAVEAGIWIFHAADHILLVPSTVELRTPSATRSNVPWQGGNAEVIIQRSPACNGGEPAAFVLVYNGNASRAEDMIEWMADQRYRHYPVEVWAMNYPGYGNSDGPARLKSMVPASLAAFDELQRVAGGRPIFIDGTSIGTTCAISVASQRPVAAMILQDPPPLQREVLQRYGWWNLWLLASPVALQVPRDMSSVRNGLNVKTPALFVLSDHDEVVPPYYHQIVVDAYGGPKTVIDLPNATHSAPVDAVSDVKLHAWLETQWRAIVPQPSLAPATQGDQHGS